MQIDLSNGIVETVRNSQITILGPSSHNHVPGDYRANGKRFGFYEEAERETKRGWIPRLRKALENAGPVNVVVEYDPLSCWVSGAGPTAKVTVQGKGWWKTVSCLPVAGRKASEIQKTLPTGWVAKETWWEKH